MMNFELWARECVRVVDKLTGRPVPFVLNAPQRRVLARLEAARVAGKPIRLIILKARQWGCSTLIQTYMAWLQLEVREGWNSVICAHVKDASAAIKGIYSRLLAGYPEEKRQPNPALWKMKPYEGSQTVNIIPARDALVALATANAPNAVRGYNFSMAHLSEVAFWGDGREDVAAEIVRTVSGTVPMVADSLVVMESTANGTDNFFYREWERAVAGLSDKEAIFVPWYESEIYRADVGDARARHKLLSSLDAYEQSLMSDYAVSLEAVAWYHAKRREYTSHEAFMAEFPSTPREAFATSGTSPFAGSPEPEVVGSTAGISPLLTVAVPSADRRKPHYAAEFGIIPGSDAMICLGERECPTLSGLLPTRGGLLILDLRDGDKRAPLRPLLQRAEERGIAISRDANEEPLTLFDAAMEADLAEELKEALVEGKIRERSAEGARMYADYRPGRPTAPMAARMAARRAIAEARKNAVCFREMVD